VEGKLSEYKWLIVNEEVVYKRTTNSTHPVEPRHEGKYLYNLDINEIIKLEIN
jgi:hypothetical protein